MSYQEVAKQQDVMLKMLMQLEYMIARLNIVEVIMKNVYKEAGEQK